ncbi:hypothetical protein [Cellulomonas sp. ICMP 17802]|uniref:hypothetical protein n=1 Tax=Cellulomonas sp. ICMP 17802 TaxID=3239199 RepID=UPI00351B1F0F
MSIHYTGAVGGYRDGEAVMKTAAWNDPALQGGTMVRGALWLVQEVGIGNTFTKEDIRQAFPGIAQADRRIRDLRDFGWILHTRADDASLTREQNRFVTEGVAVWNPRERRAAASAPTISSKARDDVMARDGFVCTICGIAGGEGYPDDAMLTAVLAVSSRPVRLPGGATTREFVTECKRCRAGQRERDADGALADALALPTADIDRLIQWIRQEKRDVSALERAWGRYLRLTPAARAAVRARLGA